MDLSLSESEQMLKESVQAFVRRDAGREVLIGLEDAGRSWRPDWLATLADAGWLGAFVPRELGGAGASTLEAVVIFEELGKGPVPGPMIPSSIVSTCVLRHFDASPTRDALLSGIAAGTEIVVPALRDPETSWRGIESSTAQIGASGRLSCTKLYVPYADAATHFLVSLRAEREDGARFAVVPAGARGVGVRPLSGWLRASYEVTFDNVELDSGHVLNAASAGDLDSSLAPGLVALAAYQAGGCEGLFDMSLDYASVREQFGQPIGRFQRVQDHVIRLLNATDAARWTAYEAAWVIDNGRSGTANAHMAAAVASDSYVEAADAGHEVHAGIGSDPKYGMTLYTQASRSLYEYLGPPDWHRMRMADCLGWVS